MNDPCPPLVTKEDPSAWIATKVSEMDGYIKVIVDNVAKLNLNDGSTSVSHCLFYVDKACKGILCVLRILERARESTRVEKKNLEDAMSPLRSGYGQAIEAARQRVAEAEEHEVYAKLVAGPINRAVMAAINKAIGDNTLDLLSALEDAIRLSETRPTKVPSFKERATEILKRVTGLESLPEEDEPGVPDASAAASGGAAAAAAGGAGKGRKTRAARNARKSRKNKTRNRRRR